MLFCRKKSAVNTAQNCKNKQAMHRTNTYFSPAWRVVIENKKPFHFHTTVSYIVCCSDYGFMSTLGIKQNESGWTITVNYIKKIPESQ